MKQLYTAFLCIYFLSVNAQDNKLFDYQWKLEKIVTNTQTYIAQPYTSGDPSTAVLEEIEFTEYNGYFSFIFGYYGNGGGEGLIFDDLNSSFQISNFSNHLGGYSPSEAFFSEEFIYIDPNQMTIQNPFSYNFSYQGDFIYLVITNNDGSTATFFDDFTSQSQVTLIPDQEFEQALVDQNIDSDGIINGQVLTTDIENLEDLDLGLNAGLYFITDFTGLQDFALLENLTIDNLDLSNTADQTLNLTANSMLESVIMNGGDDAFTHFLEKIDLSDNPNINQIQTTGIWPLRQLDLKTGNIDVSNLDIDISIAPLDLLGGQNEDFNNDLFCIKVTDEAAATAGTGVYSTWTITANNNPYYFSETCTLSTDRFSRAEVIIYHDPASELLYIESNNFQFNKLQIYNLQGQIIKVVNAANSESINISELAQGTYIIHLEGENGIASKKFIKQ
jgi:hypothetical protein